MSQTKYDICTRALRRIGAASIDSFEDGTTESNIAGAEYEPLVEELLSERRWRFATKESALNHITTVPQVRWSELWQLPSDMLDLHGVFLVNSSGDDIPIDYERIQDRIACDYDETHTLYAVYTARFDETYWPAYFTRVVVESLEAVFAEAIKRDSERAANIRRRLDEVTKPIARARDGQQQTARKLPPSRLVAIRRV